MELWHFKKHLDSLRKKTLIYLHQLIDGDINEENKKEYYRLLEEYKLKAKFYKYRPDVVESINSYKELNGLVYENFL